MIPHTIDWQSHIDSLAEVHALIKRFDIDDPFDYGTPSAAATEDELLGVETHLGEALDPQYRAFLRTANGWPAFSCDFDLFGTDDLLGGPRMQMALELLSYLVREPVPDYVVVAEDLLPIAVSQTNIDVFFISRRHTAHPGRVFWYAGARIEEYETFEAFFLHALALRRTALEEARKQSSDGG
jgi:hypothetical protein